MLRWNPIAIAIMTAKTNLAFESRDQQEKLYQLVEKDHSKLPILRLQPFLTQSVWPGVRQNDREKKQLSRASSRKPPDLFSLRLPPDLFSLTVKV